MMSDLITGVVGTLFSLFYLYETTTVKVFGGSATAGINAQTVPKMWGTCFLVLSIILVVRGLIKWRRGQHAVSMRTLIEQIRSRREVVYTFILLILYAAVMKPLGFILSSMLYAFFQIWVLTPIDKRTKKSHIIAAVLAIVFSIGLYYIFTKYLMIMLPPGILK